MPRAPEWLPSATVRGSSSSWLPVQLVEVDIGQPLPDLRLAAYGAVVCLVRLHTQPLGLIELRPTAGCLDAEEYARQIWAVLAQAVRHHLREDGLTERATLTARGVPFDGRSPPCLVQREQLLAKALPVSVVVPTRDRPRDVATCLPPLARLAYPNYEVIVVDNAPTTNATAQVVEQMAASFRHLRYVRSSERGASRARNLGLRQAAGEIVAFTDDDAVVDQHWLTELVRGFDTGPDIACVTGAVLPRELETPAQVWLEEFGGYCKGFDRRMFDLAANRTPDALYPYLPGSFGSGQSMAFRTTLLRRMGGFDPTLGPGTPTRGGEDLAAFLQVISNGHQLAYEPGALVFHAHPRDLAGLKDRMRTYGLGLTALLTRHMLRNPGVIPDLLPKIPRGVAYALDPRSRKNYRKQKGYPAELTRIELAYMALGPAAYVWSSWLNLMSKRRRQAW